MPVEVLTSKLRAMLRRIGPWAFARYMRNQGYKLSYTLHVMFPAKYRNAR